MSTLGLGDKQKDEYWDKYRSPGFPTFFHVEERPDHTAYCAEHFLELTPVKHDLYQIKRLVELEPADI